MPVSITCISTSSPRRRTPTSTRPLRVYLMALETRFWISRRSRLRSVFDARATSGTIVSSSFFSAAIGMKSVPIWRSSAAELEHGLGRLHGAGVETRNVEHGAEDGLDQFQRGFDVGAPPRRVALAGPLDQRGAIEPRGVERLQDVVAGGRQEARLAEIGLLGQHLRLRQLLVDARQLGGAVPDPLLQRLVDALQREVGLDARGDVGIGGDQPAVGHRVGAQLDRCGRLSSARSARARRNR